MDNSKLQNIKQITDILTLIDCDYWLNDEGNISVLKTDFLEWSDVLDLYYRLLNLDFRIEKTEGKLEDNFSVVLEKNGSSVGLFWFYDCADILSNASYIYNKSDILPLKEAKFGDFIFNVAQSYVREN